MAKYFLTKKAVEDLTAIWNYSFEFWSENQADKYYSELLEDCGLIAKNPNLGKQYPNIAKELYGYNSGQHIIFYRRQSKNEIEITRFLHGSMDLKNRIKE
ncbi:MAG: type II toxin-antitoxin system RelE/ParE family toxin [Bacteroidia bacterium]|nr:type II toxin-antitoxin system RelE/ParE family toxin [Bacteroidia bacterium]